MLRKLIITLNSTNITLSCIGGGGGGGGGGEEFRQGLAAGPPQHEIWHPLATFNFAQFIIMSKNRGQKGLRYGDVA